jgi:hypothetical protein
MSAPGPVPTAAAIDRLLMQVNRDTVLQAHSALLGEAWRLADSLGSSFDLILFGRCGGDPVSADAQVAFTERIGGLLDQCHRHVADLFAGADRLAAAARAYGHTEDAVAASFTRR